MLHFLNRTKLLITSDLEHLSQVRETLMDAGIECVYRSRNLRNPAFFSETRYAQADSSGIRGKRIEYELYVRKTELDRAKALL